MHLLAVLFLGLSVSMDTLFAKVCIVLPRALQRS